MPSRRHRRERYTYEPETDTHVFLPSARTRLWQGSCCLVTGIFAAIGGVTLLATNDATPGIAFLIAGVFGIATGIRCFQVRLVITSRDLAAHNVLRVRRADLSTVAAVNIARRKQGEAGTNWFAQLHLVDGRTFWIDALDLGGTKTHPSKEGFDLVGELRRRLNVGGVSNSEARRSARLSGT